MSTESSQTSERVITIVQSSLPVTSATALDVDPSDVEHIGEIPLDGLQGLGVSINAMKWSARSRCRYKIP